MDYGVDDGGNASPGHKRLRRSEIVDREYQNGEVESTDDDLPDEDTDDLERKQRTVRGRVRPSPRKTPGLMFV